MSELNAPATIVVGVERRASARAIGTGRATQQADLDAEPGIAAHVSIVGERASALRAAEAPGARVHAGIRVVNMELAPRGVGSAMIRGLGGIVDGFFRGCVGVLAVTFSRHRQRFGDRMAGTIVIRRRG